MRKKKSTTDAVEILWKEYFEGHPELQAELEEEMINLDIAQQIYDLRMKSGLTQKQLAERVGTSTSVISRLEDADYQGHSLSMLRRIAAALGGRVEVKLVARKKQGK